MANNLTGSDAVAEYVEDVDDLAQFRNQWKKELTGKTGGAGENNSELQEAEVDQENQEDDVHRRARDLFMQGVYYEQDGKLYEAIRFYKKAEKLVPNIERQAYKFNAGKSNANNSKKETVKDNAAIDDNGNVEPINDNEEDCDISNLCAKFGKMRTNGQCAIVKEFESNTIHIGQLPSEVLNYIIKWVVSSELDLKSLENCSQVCRGFYMAARDEEIWKLVCFRMWGSSSLNRNFYASWREMFLTKPRIHFNGCYVSKMRYLREGERGFQDQETYKAWHIVEYNRYLRFFPGGQVIMALSSDDEAIIAKQLNSKSGGLNIPGAMSGRYKISDNVLVCVLHKPKSVPKKTTTRYKRRGRKEIDASYEVPDQDFHLEFYISGSKWSLLEWKHFDLVSKYSNGNENVDNFQIRDQNKYPSVRFKYVGSYQFESLSPLV